MSLSFTCRERKIDYSQQHDKGTLTSTGAFTYNRADKKRRKSGFGRAGKGELR